MVVENKYIRTVEMNEKVYKLMITGNKILFKLTFENFKRRRVANILIKIVPQ